MLLQSTPATDVSLDSILAGFMAGIMQAVPKLLTGVLFLVLAYVGIKLVLWVVRSVADRAYRDSEDLIVDLSVTVVGVFLWFGAILALLSIVGMGDIAASLGTATGFIGLGVAFALKEMIADTVAGVYLLRDPDFNVGDRVDAASVTGTIDRIDLRKTRFEIEGGERVVVANRDIEKRWTRKLSAD